MTSTELADALKSFRERICGSIALEPAGPGRFIVRSPFIFDDGDEIGLVLKHHETGWVLSDEGQTLMHLSYRLDERDFNSGNRGKLIGNALSMFGVQDRDGELVIPIQDEQYGDALYGIAQTVLKIADVSYLSRERVRSTFLEDFRSLMREAARNPSFDWRSTDDPKGHYPIDCYVPTGGYPLYVYALGTDDRVRDATISILHFEQMKTRFKSLGIFADQEEVNRKVLARFSDVCEKQFSSLSGSRSRIIDYIREAQEGQEA